MIQFFNKIFRTLFLVFSLLHINNGFAQLKHQNKLISGVEKYSLIIKFKQNAITDIIKNKPIFTDSLLQIYPNINRTFDTYSFQQVLPVKKISKNSTLKNKKFDINKFKGLVYVKEIALLSKDKVLELAKYFETYNFVEYASLSPKFNKPPPPSIASSNFTKPIIKTFSPYSTTTPDFTSLQGYLKDYVENDVYGIDIEYAWSLGIYGQGVKAADIEWGFDYNHEDLISPNFIELIEGADHSYDYHGTAVCGVLIGKDNGFGITGAVHELDVLYGLSHYAYQGTELAYRPEFTILEAITKLNEGDVLVLEMQGYNFQILDFDQSIWDIIKAATDSGIIVIEAAGNGLRNLDGTTYDDYRNRGDNGAIIVGAGTRKGRNKVSSSNYGSKVQLQAWGDASVVTTGPYGIENGNILYDGGPHAQYTGTFRLTSASTPIVASAAISLQSYAKNIFNKILTPIEIRDILISTGTPQGTGGHIGPLPNVKRAIEKLAETLHTDQLHSKDIDIKVFPNPTKDKIKISGIMDLLNIKLYNINGQLLKTYNTNTIDLNEFNYTNTIDLNEFNSGLYFLKIISQNKQFSIKVVKK